MEDGFKGSKTTRASSQTRNLRITFDLDGRSWPGHVTETTWRCVAPVVASLSDEVFASAAAARAATVIFMASHPRSTTRRDGDDTFGSRWVNGHFRPRRGGLDDDDDGRGGARRHSLASPNCIAYGRAVTKLRFHSMGRSLSLSS